MPNWVENPLGRYYLYFADHKGRYIRLAYADELTGPWQIHDPGSLQLERSHFPTEPIEPPKDVNTTGQLDSMKLHHSAEYERSTPHIASPDVHVVEEQRQIYMYFHGLASYGIQRTRLATSTDGISFRAEQPILCSAYLRVVPFQQSFLGMIMPGVLYELGNRRGPFENGQRLFTPDARHHAMLVNRTRVHVFWTEVGDAPEHIKVSVIDLRDGFKSLHISQLGSILKPELDWEGASAKLELSVRSVAYGCVNQLRDPCVFVDDGRVYLLYAGGGESAIGIADLKWVSN